MPSKKTHIVIAALGLAVVGGGAWYWQNKVAAPGATGVAGGSAAGTGSGAPVPGAGPGRQAGGPGAGGGAGLGHRKPLARQVLHQTQVERQLPGVEALEQRQHPFTLVGGDKVVGVLDAGTNALQRQQLTRTQPCPQRAGGLGRDFGEDGHGGPDQKVSTGQTRWPAPSRALDGSPPGAGGLIS